VRVWASDGSAWRVQRYPLFRRARTFDRTRRAMRHPAPAGLGEFSGNVVRAEATGWVALIDVLVAALRGLAAPVVAPIGIALCLARLRPWPVTARRLGRSRRIHRWQVTGRTASNDLLAEIVDALRTGRHLPEGDLELR
jgi:hypothetical protein